MALAASLVQPRLAVGQAQVGNITGEIRITRVGLPDKQILVNLNARGASINSAYADDQGRFGFYSLPGGAYSIVIKDDDYDPVEEDVILNLAVSTTAFARITLTPKSERKASDTAGRVPGSNPNVVDLAEYTRKFPKKVVKEYEKGLDASLQSQPDVAMRHFQKAIELAPHFYPAHNELGRIYMARSEFDSAQNEFREAIRLNQSDAEAHLNLGNVFLLTRKYDDALRNVEEGLRREPNSGFGQFILGSIYERTGKTAEAEHALRQALVLDPTMTKVHLELVNLYLGAGKKAEARSELKAFLKDFPNDPFAPKAREVLDKLGADSTP
jgi:tetratricopeptide (TPR) repeat protein